MEKRYLVVRDLQCNDGEFGMYRIQTAEEWRENAMEWCDADENYETEKYLKNIKDDKELIDFIADFWDLEIEEYNEIRHLDLVREWTHKGYDLGLVKMNTRFVVLVDEDSNMLPTLVEFKYPIDYGNFRFKFQYFKRELCSKDDYEYDDLYRWIDDNYEVKKMTFLDNLIHFVEYI